jgi:predicted secreted hydrolase
MRTARWLLLFCCAAGVAASEWKTAEPGWRYEFPRDHRSHLRFKTEWWYFTGNAAEESGRRFGYELTFFREGLRPPSQRTEPVSRFVVDDLKFAHFAITDVSGKRFVFQQKTSRGSFGEAGFDDGNRIAWIRPWALTFNDDGSFDLLAENADAAARLHLRPSKPPVVHGENGISAKASAAGHASHYYSITRLDTTGELRVGGVVHAVSGESWFDHEWATNQLAPEEVGWNWLSVQLADGTELMLYQMRLANGLSDPSSSGTLVERDGRSVHLSAAAFRMTPTRFWQSKTTPARYPVGWEIDVPEHQLHLQISPVLDDQELALGALTYWEGAIDVTGSRDGRAIPGHGYLELTGYAGALSALHR